jgi:hypothetical protein
LSTVGSWVWDRSISSQSKKSPLCQPPPPPPNTKPHVPHLGYLPDTRYIDIKPSAEKGQGKTIVLFFPRPQVRGGYTSEAGSRELRDGQKALHLGLARPWARSPMPVQLDKRMAVRLESFYEGRGGTGFCPPSEVGTDRFQVSTYWQLLLGNSFKHPEHLAP